MTEAIGAAQHVGVNFLGDGGLRVAFVHQRDVMKDVPLLDEHFTDAGVDDHGHLAREGRVIGLAVRDRRGDQVTGPVLVLQPFAAQRGATRRRSQQEATRPLVSSSPDLIAHALKAKHRVE